MSNAAYIRHMLPHASAAIGLQHPWLVSWAIAKSIVETGGNLQNILIINANNALGIKAEISGVPIPGVDFFLARANTGPEAGKHIYWRKFATLQSCFLEFANQLNYRKPFKPFRNMAMVGFENIYTNGLASHANKVLREYGDVQLELRATGLMDEKGMLSV